MDAAPAPLCSELLSELPRLRIEAQGRARPVRPGDRHAAKKTTTA